MVVRLRTVLSKRLGFHGLVVGACFALSSVTYAASNKPAVDKNTVVVGIGKSIGTLDGTVAAGGDSQRYSWQIYDTLYAFDEKGNVQPSVATGVEISEDGLSYTFPLRDDVLFHNGEKLTSADVKYSVERVLDPAVKSTRRPYLVNLIEGVETNGDAEVTIHLKHPDGAFLNKVAGFFLLVPKAYAESFDSPEDFARAPVASGPYRFVDQKVGHSITFARFDDYWGQKPGVETLVYRLIPEAASRVNAIISGEVDIADLVPGADVERLKKNDAIAVKSVPVGSPLAVRLYSNVPGEPLAKREVRLALNYGLDTEAIIKSVLHGIGRPLTSYVSSAYPYGVDDSLLPYPYDPVKAKELLVEAGYPDGFKADLYCSSDQAKGLCEAIPAYWSQLGVQINTKIMDYAAWARLNNTHQAGPMSVMQYSNVIYDPLNPISGAASKNGTWSDYFNPEVEELIQKAGSAVDLKERDDIVKNIGRLLQEDAHAVLISELYQTYAQNADLNWEPQYGSAYYGFRQISWK